jgi:hypothetical protein
MGQFQKSHDCEYILVAVDYVSKWFAVAKCKLSDNKGFNYWNFFVGFDKKSLSMYAMNFSQQKSLW